MEANTKTPVVIWGASGHAATVDAILAATGQYEVLGFLDEINQEANGKEFRGRPILGGDEALADLRTRGIHGIALGMGQCAARLRVGHFLLEHGFRLVTGIHPRAILAPDVTVGVGTIIQAGTFVNTQTCIGDFVIISAGATIGHDCVIEAGAHLAPGVHIAGDVRIGSGSWIGIGSCIREKINIGTRCLIGAGSVVVQSIPGGVKAYGNPARIIEPAPAAF